MQQNKSAKETKFEPAQVANRAMLVDLDAIARKLLDENVETDKDEIGLEAVRCPHNHREVRILYPMMDRVFSDPERAGMFSEMTKRK